MQLAIEEVPPKILISHVHARKQMCNGRAMDQLYFSLQQTNLSNLWWSVVISYYLYGSHTQRPQINHSPIVRGSMQIQRME